MSGKSDLIYERYRLGELSESERAELESEKDFKERIAGLEASDAEILAKYPTEEMVAAIRQRIDRESSAHDGGDTKIIPFTRRIALPLAAAAVLAIALIVAIPTFGPGDDVIRTKGVVGDPTDAAPELLVFRRVSGETQVLKNGSTAAENDLLQLAYSAREGVYGAIFSVDGGGVFTFHWPDEGVDAVPLDSGTEVSLPFAYQLDDAPDFETFYLVWSEGPFELEPLEYAARGSSGMDGAFDLTGIVEDGTLSGQVSITLRK